MVNREIAMKSFLDYFIEINILLILFALPFSKSAIEVCITLALIACIAKKIFIERAIKIKIDKKILTWLIIFIIFNLLSIVNSQYPRLSILALFSKVLKWAAFFLVIVDTMKTPRQVRRVFITMLFSCALILADAVYQQYITGLDFLHYPNRYPVFKFHGIPQGGTTFPTASFPFPGDFAAWVNIYLCTFLFIAYFYLRKNIKVYSVTMPIYCIFLFYFLFLSASTGAILGFLFSLTAILIMNAKKLFLPTVGFLIAITIIAAFVPYLRTYLRDGILDERLSVTDRLNMWSTGWRIFKEHPLIGNGVNTFFEHYKNFRTDEARYISGSYAHNCFLQMASDAGLGGLISFLSFAFLILYSNLKKSLKALSAFENCFTSGLSFGVIAFLVHSFFDTNLYSLNLSALFWLSIGLVEGIGSQAGEIQ